ncbi:MAG: pantetheine-phosphate adenylyltransferase [Fibrobacter sp.]|jgi:pantetheine-phosphate adenylyltransferase|nr:pantetheine-phosphate adenylyltransferase [Fibrobacter sp.]
MISSTSKKAVFAGSFDPFTAGHLWVAEHALKVFDSLTILVAENVRKQSLFSVSERKKIIELSTAHLPQVHADSFSGLTADYLKAHHIPFLVRGVRGGGDFEENRNFARINRDLYPDCETFFLACPPELCAVSSSLVRELLNFNADVSLYVPPAAREYLETLRRK